MTDDALTDDAIDVTASDVPDDDGTDKGAARTGAKYGHTNSSGQRMPGLPSWYMPDGFTLRRDYWMEFFVSNNTTLKAMSNDGGSPRPGGASHETLKVWHKKYKWAKAKKARLKALANEPPLIKNLANQLEQVRQSFRVPLDIADPRKKAYKEPIAHYSDQLHDRLRPFYVASLQDPQQLSLKRDIASADMIMSELADRLRLGHSSADWEQLKAQHIKLKRAVKHLANGDLKAAVPMQEAMDNIDDVLEHPNDSTTLKQLKDWQEHRRKLIHTEFQRAKHAADYLNANDAGALIVRRMGVILDVVKDHGDEELSKNIAIALAEAAQTDPLTRGNAYKGDTTYPVDPTVSS